MKHFTTRLTLAIFFLTSIAFDCRSQISGTNTLLFMNNNTATTVDPSINISETGNITDVNVQISAGYISGSSGDILSYTGSLPSGISASYDNIKGVLNFTGTASPSNWQTLLRTVQFKSTNATCYASKRNVTFVLGNKLYNPSNGHYYEEAYYQTWSTAKSMASSKSYFGREGYLATLTTDDENSFVFVNSHFNSWIGASDNYLEINAATGVTTFANQAAADGNFYWVVGPEKGTPVSTKNSWESGGTSAVSGSFMNWYSGEPNDYPDFTTSTPGQEDYVQFYTYDGKWNDNSSTATSYFLIEYGDMQNDLTTNTFAQTTRAISLNNAPSGQISGDVYVCSGSNSAKLTLTAPSGGFASITRWEKSFDQYFTNPITISNTTTTLNLSGLTQNAYYRAIVNKSSPSCSNLPTSMAKVTMNNVNGTWTGTTYYTWNNPNNWCGGTPTSSTDVIIPPGTEYLPTVEANSQCRNLSILPGGRLTFDVNQKLEIFGKINCNASINAGGDIELKGSSAQVLPSSAFENQLVDDITINNSNGVTLSGNLLVVTDLRFSNGIFYTSATNMLSIGSSANLISGAGAGKYIDGPLRHLGSNDFKFEVGKNGKYAPCLIENQNGSASTDFFTAEYVKNPYGNLAMDASLVTVSGKEHWLIGRNAGTSNNRADITLFYNDATFSGIVSSTSANLRVAHFNSTSQKWEDLDGTGTPTAQASAGAGYAKLTKVSTFSPFTFGSPSGFNPLPVSLINFVAIPDNTTKTVALNWETVSEENNKYFEVMHSTDFITWKSIGIVNSKGANAQMNNYTFNHMNPASVNHYKLKEVANNGDYSYSDIKLARFSDIADGKVSIYPNPSVGSITVANAAEETNFEITDITGKIIRTGNFNHTIQIDNLPKGVYIIKIVSEGFIQNDKIVIQ